MRSGDVLHKVETGYVGGGESGLNKTWSIGQAVDESKDFHQAIVSNGDTVAVFENGNIKHFIMHGDTLCFKGNQQRRSFLLYDKERPVIRFPFAFGDSISSNYTATGVDENTDLSVNGWGYSVADGTGTLCIDDITIPHISRIRMFDDYVENYGNQAEIHILCNRFLWYCAGYRYPVMESIRRTIVENDGNENPLDSVTYLYLPIQQGDLATDAENDSILSRLGLFYGKGGSANNANGEEGLANKTNGGNLSSLQAVLSADGRTINICYTLSADSELRISAYDVMGSQLGISYYNNKEAGEWQESMSLNRKPIANVLMLHACCNGDTTSIKVYY